MRPVLEVVSCAQDAGHACPVLQVVDVGLRVPALPSRALTASPPVFVTSCCSRARTRHPSRPPLQSHRTRMARVLALSEQMRGRKSALRRSRHIENVLKCPGPCHKSALAYRGSRPRAARATGSAGRHGWRVRARHQQDLTKICGDAVSAREASAGTRRPASTDWSARRTLGCQARIPT